MATSHIAEEEFAPPTAPPAGGDAGTSPTRRPRSAREEANRQLRQAYLDLAQEAELHDGTPLGRRLRRKADEVLSDFCRVNDPLIGEITRKYRTRPGSGHAGGDFTDLEQTGRLALLEAFHCWNVDGAPFANWAWPRISGAVWREVAHQRGQNHRDFGRRRLVFQAEGSLATELGRRPSDEEVAAFCEIPVAGVRRARISSPISLDAPAGDNGASVGDLLADTEDNPVVDGRSDAILAQVAASLPATELALLLRCLGVGDTALDNGPRQKVSSAAATIGLNRESARRRYHAALAVARAALSQQG
jgi:DNA-directed RNA polymerase specialized sigma subunit